MQIRVGTYNIQHGRNHSRFLETGTEEIDLLGVAAVLRNLAPDICALNEVRNQEQVPGLCNQAQVIAEALGYHYVFARAIDHQGGTYGNALISRYPIRNPRLYPLIVPSEQTGDGHKHEDRVLLTAEITAADVSLTVMVCHFSLYDVGITLAIDTIAEVLAQTEGDVVLMGDFNLTPDTPHYARLASLLSDTATGADSPLLTFPSHAPTEKIDYVFASPVFQPSEVTVPAVTQSDHRPYIVTLNR